MNSKPFMRYSHIPLALIGAFASSGVLAFDMPPATHDGWKLVGINAKSRIFWIRPASIAGGLND